MRFISGVSQLSLCLFILISGMPSHAQQGSASTLVKMPKPSIKGIHVPKRMSPSFQGAGGGTGGGPYCYYSDFYELEDAMDLCAEAGGTYSTAACQCGWVNYGGGGGGTRSFQPTNNSTPILMGIEPDIWPAGSTTTVIFSGEFFGTNPPGLNLSDPSISYTVYSNNDTQIQASINVPPGTPDEEVAVSVTSNGYGGLHFISPAGNAASSDPVTANVQAPANAHQVTVVAWVDGQAPDVMNAIYAGPSTSDLAINLSDRVDCSLTLSKWGLLQQPIYRNTAQDRSYAAAFLINHSGNSAPPATIGNIAQFQSTGNFRLFNVYGNGSYGHSQVGTTPSPCGSPIVAAEVVAWLGNAQPSRYNGWSGTRTSTGTKWKLAEGRVGTVGQLVNFTINQRSTPWIWSVIEFDANGNPSTANHAMFPSYSYYLDGSLQRVDSQSALSDFAAHDASYVLTPAQLQ